MKNISTWILVSSFCVTALAFAQNYDYPQSQHSGYQSQRYPSQENSNYFSQGSSSQPYQAYGQPGQYQRNYGSSYQNEPGQNTQNSWLKWNQSHEDQNVPDHFITSNVIQNLRSTPYFSPGAKNIQVITKDGKVTLKGKVANSNESNQIEYMVKNVPGVKSVSNDLEKEQ